MSRLKAVRGVGWGPAAVGNAVWGGVPLNRVLQLAGVSQGAWETHSGGRHVEFVSVDRCKVRDLPTVTSASSEFLSCFVKARESYKSVTSHA